MKTYYVILTVLIILSISSHVDTKVKVSRLQENVLTLTQSMLDTREVVMRNLAADTSLIKTMIEFEAELDSVQKKIDSIVNE